MKAILVIDIDEKYIDSFGAEIQFNNQKYNCSWELKPMPEKKNEIPMKEYCWNYSDRSKKEQTFIAHRLDVENAEIIGWNACLDEITGDRQ